MSGCTCAGRHDGHGFGSSEEAEGSSRGEQGKAKERVNLLHSTLSAPPLQQNKKAEEKAANKKNQKQNSYILNSEVLVHSSEMGLSCLYSVFLEKAS